jgi:hypothetical protein
MSPAGGRRLFATIEGEKTLKTIETTTGEILDTIPMTGRPNECAATPDGRYVASQTSCGQPPCLMFMRIQAVRLRKQRGRDPKPAQAGMNLTLQPLASRGDVTSAGHNR